MRKVGFGSCVGKPRNYSFLSRLRSANKTRGLQGGKKKKPTTQQPPTEWTPVPLALTLAERGPPKRGHGAGRRGRTQTHTQIQTPSGEKGRKPLAPCAPQGWVRINPGLVCLPPREGVGEDSRKKSCPPTAELV